MKDEKELIDQMMKVSETNPDVILYMQALMESYEKLENKLNKIISSLEDALENKLPNGESADIGYWERQCKELLQIAKGTEK